MTPLIPPVHAALTQVRALLADPAHWGQGGWARTLDGELVAIRDPDAQVFCLYGACLSIDAPRATIIAAVNVLLVTLHARGACLGSGAAVTRLEHWNDRHATHAAVLALLDQALGADAPPPSPGSQEGL